MNAYTRAGNVEGAERVLTRMLEDDEARPNVHTYTTLMNVYVKANMPQGAEKVRTSTSQHLLICYNSLFKIQTVHSHTPWRCRSCRVWRRQGWCRTW